MTPTKDDFTTTLAAVQNEQLLTTHQISVIVAALRGAAESTMTMAEEEAAYDNVMSKVPRWAKAEQQAVKNSTLTKPALTKPEISLLPAILAKMTESCDLLSEMRDMMRRKIPESPHKPPPAKPAPLAPSAAQSLLPREKPEEL